MGKRQKSGEKYVENADKDKIHQIMSSIPNFDGPSTSAEAEKIRKVSTAAIVKRRVALDDIRDLNNIDSSNVDGFEKDYEEKTNVNIQPDCISIDVSELENFKRELKDEMRSLKRSIQYDLKKMNYKMDKIEFQISTTNNSHSLSDMQKKLTLQVPISDLEKFYDFNDKIKTNNEFTEMFRELLGFKSRAKSLYEAIGGVLSIIMSQDLQLKFSACGKPNKGVAKLNLSSTHVYTELKDTLLKQFEKENDATILSKVSRWLANAKDRHGGRNSR